MFAKKKKRLHCQNPKQSTNSQSCSDRVTTVIYQVSTLGVLAPIEFPNFRVCYHGNVTTENHPPPVDLTLRENFSLSFVPELLNGLSIHLTTRNGMGYKRSWLQRITIKHITVCVKAAQKALLTALRVSTGH